MVKCRLSPAPCLFLLNNKKRELSRLEEKYGVRIFILADGRLKADEYEFEMDSGRAGTSISEAPKAKAPVQAEPEDREPQRLVDEEEEEAALAARRMSSKVDNDETGASEKSSDSENADQEHTKQA
jgi:hypothetical protein